MRRSSWPGGSSVMKTRYSAADRGSCGHQVRFTVAETANPPHTCLMESTDPRHGAPKNGDPENGSCSIEPARVQDAVGIAAVHVDVWRTAYPGLVPDHSLTSLSVARLAPRYRAAILREQGIFVARATQEPQVVGFTTVSTYGRGRPAEGEVETLYVLDDWREGGVGRALLRRAARHLADRSCRSLFLWVLEDNPSRWFYERLGGRPALRSMTQVGGRMLPQTAMVWSHIEALTEAG